MDTTRAEHLVWCKQRAHAELNVPDEAEGIKSAWTSMVSDLTNHPETRKHDALGLGMMMVVGGQLSTKAKMAEFIDGFN